MIFRHFKQQIDISLTANECLSPSPEGEGWDGGAFDFKSKKYPHLNLSPNGEDFNAKALQLLRVDSLIKRVAEEDLS